VVGYDKPFTLSGRITAPPGCDGIYEIALSRAPFGSEETTARARVATASDGTWSLEDRAPVNSTYFAEISSGPCSGDAAAPIDVLVRAQVSASAPRRCKNSGVVTGTVRPDKKNTSVRLERKRKSGYAKVATDRLDRSSRYRMKIPKCTGSYRVVWPTQDALNERGQVRFGFSRGGGGSRRALPSRRFI